MKSHKPPHAEALLKAAFGQGLGLRRVLLTGRGPENAVTIELNVPNEQDTPQTPNPDHVSKRWIAYKIPVSEL